MWSENYTAGHIQIIWIWILTRRGPGKRDGAGTQHCHTVGRLDPSGAGRWCLYGIFFTHSSPTSCTGLQLIHISEEKMAEQEKAYEKQTLYHTEFYGKYCLFMSVEPCERNFVHFVHLLHATFTLSLPFSHPWHHKIDFPFKSAWLDGAKAYISCVSGPPFNIKSL